MKHRSSQHQHKSTTADDSDNSPEDHTNQNNTTIHIPIFNETRYRAANEMKGREPVSVGLGNNQGTHSGTGRVQILVNGRYTQDKPITDITVTVPFPKALKNINLTPNYGTIRLDQVTKVLQWEIGQLRENQSPILEGTISLPKQNVQTDVGTSNLEFTGLRNRSHTFERFVFHAFD